MSLTLPFSRDVAGATRPDALLHPRTVGWFGTVAVAMGGINQSLFLLAALFAGQGNGAALPGTAWHDHAGSGGSSGVGSLHPAGLSAVWHADGADRDCFCLLRCGAVCLAENDGPPETWPAHGGAADDCDRADPPGDDRPFRRGNIQGGGPAGEGNPDGFYPGGARPRGGRSGRGQNRFYAFTCHCPIA